MNQVDGVHLVVHTVDQVDGVHLVVHTVDQVDGVHLVLLALWTKLMVYI